LRQTNLFPVHHEKSAQVTPSLREAAKVKAQRETDRAVCSPQQQPPPLASQFDAVVPSIEWSILPQQRPRKRRPIATTDLVRNLQRNKISDPPAQLEENDDDVEVVAHTGCVS
jgi:hypothetical protein